MATKLKSVQCFVTPYDEKLLRNYCLENGTTPYKIVKAFVERIAEAQDNIERSRNNEETIPANAYRLIYESERLDNLA
jgi:hypothetical protein